MARLLAGAAGSGKDRMAGTVTFFTKCWERDWRILLCEGRLASTLARGGGIFSQNVLIVNNVEEPSRVAAYAEQLVRQRVLDAYLLASDWEVRIGEEYGLDRIRLGVAFPYSNCELIEPLVARTDYYLHMAGDCVPSSSFDWVSRGVELLAGEPRVAVVNPVWGGRWWEVRLEGEARTQHFVFGQGFSDQCYLVRTETFRTINYHESNPASARYPAYGGESFEKRVDAWMRNRDLYRATAIGASYRHLRDKPVNLRIEGKSLLIGALGRVRAMWRGELPAWRGTSG